MARSVRARCSPPPWHDLPLAAGRWVADPATSALSFAVRQLSLFRVRGGFRGFDATLDVGRTLGDVAVVAEVDLGSVDTGNDQRDAHLRTVRSAS